MKKKPAQAPGGSVRLLPAAMVTVAAVLGLKAVAMAEAVAEGVGAATEDRIGTWVYSGTISEQFMGPTPCVPAFQDVPAGSRLTLLASNSGVNDAAYDGLIYAVS